MEVKAVCHFCQGTGLRWDSLVAPMDGVAVVCRKCGGTGCISWLHEPFVERKHKAGIVRVIERGFGAAEEGEEIESFGGMSYEDWEAGKPFERGMEMRKWVCPLEWSRQGKRAALSFCTVPDGFVSNCPKYKNKQKCWELYDKEAEVEDE